MAEPKILKNAAECPKCHEVVESVNRHDFKWCKCGNIGVDGGKEYIRRLYKVQMPIDRSEFEERKENASEE